MADGSITMADGLGIKAIDSHEVRKMQRNASIVRVVQISQLGISRPSLTTPQNYTYLCPEVRDTLLSAVSLQYTLKRNFVQSNVYPQRSKPRLELRTSDLSTPLPNSKNPTHSNVSQSASGA